MKYGRVLVVVVLVMLAGQVVQGQAGDYDIVPNSVLDTLYKPHPRLMLRQEDFIALKRDSMKDRVLQRYIRDVLAEADRYYARPMLKHKLIGPRLLSVSRECLARVYALALAWRWTGEEKYARKTVENMRTVCAFKDWNPSHFLDTAEMSHAVGVGYDWLYHYMDEATREEIRRGLIKNGLQPGIKIYRQGGWWTKSEYNWNQVCNGGMIIGALAIAETNPELAREIVPAALKSLPLALKSYGPDGAWSEGPGYWSYATHYTAYGITALETALGTDFKLEQIRGMRDAGTFPIYLAGPTGYYLNYADCGERSRRRALPCMFWLARTYHNPLFSQSEHAVLKQAHARPAHIVWYVSAINRKYHRDLDKYYRGKVELALMRSSWDDPQALFVGVKGGFNQVNHGHLDLGNFEMDALGVRWARDLGSDNYNLPGYWDKKKGGRRWSYYRLNSFSHNVPLLGGANQNELAKVKFLQFQSTDDHALVTIDMSEAYQDYARKSTRGVALLANRRSALVQDEFDIAKPCSVTWAMTTDAKIKLQPQGRAELSLQGQKLRARILSPAGVEFSVESAERKKPEKQNKGVRRLLVKLPQAQGEVRIAVLLSPVWPQGKVVDTVPVKALSKW